MELSRGAVNILTNMLQAGEWYGGVKYAFVAGDLLANVLPEPATMPAEISNDDAQARAWLREAFKVDLEKKSIYVKVCKAAINHGIEKKTLNPSRYLTELLSALGMSPQDSEE